MRYSAAIMKSSRVVHLLAMTILLFAGLSAPARADDEFLEPEVAFKYAAKVIDPHLVEVSFNIVDGYYLYRDKFHFSVEPDSVKLGEPQFPAGKVKNDEFFGKVEIYHGNIKIRLPIAGGQSGTGSIKLKTVYQGCAEAGICYPPQERISELKLVAATAKNSSPGGGLPSITASAGPAVAAMAKNAPQMNTPASFAAMDVPAAPVVTAALAKIANPTPPPESEESRIVALLKGGSFWAIILGFLGVGLLLALTPCVFPMIPIISGIIVGEGHSLTRMRSFLLSLSYVLGMAIMYTAAGVAAGLSGTLLSNTLQNAWVLGAFALVFVALAMSMFGFYELQLPAALQSRLADASNRVGGGKLGGSFAMGALSAIIVGPCVAAPLAGALLYIGQTRNVVLGGAALFAMALGMGVPLLLVGLSAGTLLPKAGAWMDAVKRGFGVMLLALAIWVVSPVIPAAAMMLAAAALFIVSAIYLRAVDPLPAHAHGAHRFWKGVGVISLVAGVALLIGVLSGSRDILQPLSALRLAGPASGATAMPAAHFERIKSLDELQSRLASANKPAMLDFYADWCVSCKEMERYTFSDPQVQTRFSGMLLLQADVTANNADDQALLRRFNLFGPPGIIFFDPQGKELGGARVIGYQESDVFLKTLGYVTGS
jgi:thiol:disulfide interchange protein DsbD